tara:strand:+ start:4034 stop:4516 length:483 start_codon:yes stop_codon:yes gene_type:complete
MKKTLKIDFFSNSKKWSRRLPKIKKIGLMTLKSMSSYFRKNHQHYINLILSDKEKVSKLNSKYNKKYKDTDVLTFVTKISNKELGKILYCDIFFSIDTIESFIKRNKITLYDHFIHLLIHSFLHINGFDHKNLSDFNKMKKEEIKILNKIGIENPYKINE